MDDEEDWDAADVKTLYVDYGSVNRLDAWTWRRTRPLECPVGTALQEYGVFGF